MSPRRFDRFMVRDDIGTNRKLRRLTPAQRWAFVAGVLPLASKSPLRGALLLTDTEPVTEDDISDESKTSLRDVRAMLDALRGWEMLERDEHGVEWVAGWDDINPEPKPSDLPENTRERKRQQRAKERAATAAMNGKSHASVTPNGHADVTRDSRACHDPEVEGEVEGTTDASHPVASEPKLDDARLRREQVQRIFDVWREKCHHPQSKLTPERRSKIVARLKDYSEAQILTAIEGAARRPFVNDQGKRFDDIELICRNGAKLEDFIERASGRSSAPLTQESLRGSGRRTDVAGLMGVRS